MDSILSLIKEILNDILSPVMGKGITSFMEKLHKMRFIKNISDLVREYVNNHDGTILTTGAFERYLSYYHPIEKILCLAETADGTVKSRATFIKDEARIFFDKCAEKKQDTPENRYIFNEFLAKFYDITFAYCRSLLSRNEKILLSNVKSGFKEIMENDDKNAETLSKEINELKDILRNQKTINAPETVRAIYYNISAYIWAGKGKDIGFLLPLIKDKNKDIELCVEFLLSLMKDTATKEQFEALLKNVSDDELCKDVIRKVIYLSCIVGNREMISAVSDRFNELFRIAKCVVNDEYDPLFTVTPEVKEGITYYSYEILSKKFPAEEWLVLRISILKIFETNTANAIEAVELLGDTVDFLDRVTIYKKKTQMIVSGMYSPEEANSIYFELDNETNGEVLFPKDILCILYGTLFKLAFLVDSGEPTKIVQKLPEVILLEDEIKMLLLQLKIDSGEADCEEILNISRKTGEYWLLNNYLQTIAATDSQRAARIVEENKYLLGNDVGVFIIYAQIAERLYGAEKSFVLFGEYERKHGGALEFWVVKLIIQLRNGISVDSELKEIFKKWQENTIHSSFVNLELEFIDILLQHNCFDEALEYIKHRAIFVGEKVEYLRRKAAALLKKKREIEALEAYLLLFSKGDCSEDVIDNIIVISINNNRDVSYEVLEKAKNSTKSRMLMLLSFCYEKTGREEEAQILLLKALLANHGENDAVFNNYLGFNYRKGSFSDSKIDWVDADTCVVLQSNKENNIKHVCVHKHRILPMDKYEWEKAIHIYKETSIQLGIFRKKVGDIVSLEGEEYTIIELFAIDTFLFRTCMGKLLESGEVEAITLPVDEEGNLNHSELVSSFVNVIGDDKDRDWLKDYRDLSTIPATLYIYKRYVRGTYTQLISLIIDDSTVVFREGIIEPKHSESKYILTSSALVALYKIGTQPSFGNMEVFIPTSLYRTICDETEQIVQNNNRDTVAGMGVCNGQLYFVESTEDEKQGAMREAVMLKEFCSKFNELENHSDLQIDITDGFDLKEVLGISDYDALLLAKQDNITLVVPEPIIALLGNIEEINIKMTGIADFLVEQNMEPLELLSHIKKMMEYRFQVPITRKLISYIVNAYNESDFAIRDKILDSWDELMEIAISDDKYKAWLSELFSVIWAKEKDALEEYNPIWMSFMFCTMRCKGFKLEFYVDEKGNLSHRIVEDVAQ